tara:strand:- start:370 stop:945 length:576 start_codon:yes stop_codon:yes gene_type:complete
MSYTNKYNILDQIISNFRSREIRKNFDLKNKKILDFGCGPNFKDLEKRYSSCSKVTLIDKIGEPFNNDKIEFINFNNDLEYLDNKIIFEDYDFIFLLAIIEHLEKPEDVIKILKKKISDNGVLFITAPGKKSKWILEFLAYKLKLINAELIREHKRYYDKFEYEKLSKLSDTKIIKFYYFEFGLNTVCLMK